MERQRFRINYGRTFFGMCYTYKALNDLAKEELWKYHPELSKSTVINLCRSGSKVAQDTIVIPEGMMRRYLPVLKRL